MNDKTIEKLLQDARRTSNWKRLHQIANDLERFGAWGEAANVRHKAMILMEREERKW